MSSTRSATSAGGACSIKAKAATSLGALRERESLKGIFGQPDEVDDVDVCEKCWERIKREARKEADHG